MGNKKEVAEDKMESIESALTSAESFIIDNQKRITNVVLAVLIIVVAVLALYRYYIVPNRHEAAVQMFPAEQYFGADSLQLALHGDGNNLGFLDIIDQYGSTPSGKLARYYAGISYLRLGEFENALTYLNKVKVKDQMVSNIVIGAIGDANAELGNYDEAIASYLKAASKANSETSPIYLFRAGLLYEKMQQYDKALKLFTQIKQEYAASEEGRSIDKYISRIETLNGQQ